MDALSLQNLEKSLRPGPQGSPAGVLPTVHRSSPKLKISYQVDKEEDIGYLSNIGQYRHEYHPNHCHHIRPGRRRRRCQRDAKHHKLERY